MSDLPSEQVDQFQTNLLAWAQDTDNLREFPWRETSNPYNVLVAEVLLSATLATKVGPVYRRVISDYPNGETLGKADQKEIANILKPLGLQNRRAEALVSLGDNLAGRKVPANIGKLRDLPWVDRYIANAVLCFAFDRPRPIVDTNVARVYNRMFDKNFGGSEDAAAWEFAEAMIPDSDVRLFNFALLDLGGTICIDNPRCSICPASEVCHYYQCWEH